MQNSKIIKHDASSASATIPWSEAILCVFHPFIHLLQTLLVEISCVQNYNEPLASPLLHQILRANALLGFCTVFFFTFVYVLFSSLGNREYLLQSLEAMANGINLSF